MPSDLGYEKLEFASFSDSRGSFREWFHNYPSIFTPLQANFSESHKNVIRGIHASIPQVKQRKIITCVKGSILDVVVNLRIGDKNFGKFYINYLSSNDPVSVFIDHGMGHAFQALSDQVSVVYLTDVNYEPKKEISLNPLDTELGIPWESLNPILSDKDKSAINLSDFIKIYGTSN